MPHVNMTFAAKYLQVAVCTWNERMQYRLSFVFWRVRQVIQLLVIYYLWLSVYQVNKNIFGYTESRMLTYILFGSFIRSIVLSTTTMEIHNQINQGNLSFLLIRPIDFFRYYFARDAADKLLNIFFSILEVSLMWILLQPTIFIQLNSGINIISVAAIVMGAVIYFYFSCLMSFLGFWTPDAWAPRFLSFVIIEFFAGGLFPLNILPDILYQLSRVLPFYYFIYFPLSVYLGQVSGYALIIEFSIGLVWLWIMIMISKTVWKSGLKIFTAEGR